MRAWFWVTACLAGVVVAGCGGDDKPPETSSGQSGSEADDKTAVLREQAVESLVALAKAKVGEGKTKAAIELLSQALGNDADHAAAYALRAKVHALIRQDASALADYSAAIRVDPKNARWHNARGYFLLMRGKRPEAIRDFSAAIALRPDYAEALNNRGLVRVAGQEYAEALKDFSAAIAVRETFTDAWNNRGFAHFRDGDHQKALADFDRALACNPDYVMAYNNRALVRIERKEYDQALADCSQAILLEPNNPRLYGLRREVYRRLNKSGEALADGKRVGWLLRLSYLSGRIVQAPGRAEGYIQRAEHLAGDGKSGAALADYERAIRAEPGNATEAFLARAAHWLGHNQFDKAIADCQAALAGGARQKAWSLRGEAFLGKRDLDKAIADFVRARRFDAVVAETYFKRSQQHEQAGRAAEAAADRRRAAELDPAKYGTKP